MSSSEESGPSTPQKKYKGVRCRKWGKWVSEIRIPGTQDRLWLGSYSTPEAAAVAHDVAYYCLRRPPSSSVDNFNFPHMLPPTVKTDISPRSIQKAASDAGMAIDAQLITKNSSENYLINANESGVVQGREIWEDVVDSTSGTSWEGSTESRGQPPLSISVEDYL